jgi:hypothetical protein
MSMARLKKETWAKVLEVGTCFRAGDLKLNTLQGEIVLKAERWYSNKGCSVDVPDEWAKILRKIVGEVEVSGSNPQLDEPQFNRFPYEDTGGTSYHQQRGWSKNRPKRK